MKHYLIFAVIALSLLLSLSVTAEEYTVSEAEEGINYNSEEISEFIEALPNNLSDEINELRDKNGSEIADTLSSLISFDNIKSKTENAIKCILPPGIKECIGLCILIIVSSVFGVIISSDDSHTGGVSVKVINLVVSVSFAATAYSAVSAVKEFIASICAVMNSMLPVMGAVYVSSGQITSATVSSTGLMIYTAVSENIISGLLIPFSMALLAFTTVSSVFNGEGITSVTESVKKIILWSMALGCAVFSFILGIQSSLSQSADSLSSQTVKFAIGNSVPIVGGAVSEAFSTVAAGLSLIKKTVGGIGIYLIILIILPVMLKLILTKLIFTLCGIISSMINSSDTSAIIINCNSVLSIFLGAVVMTSVLFVFALVLFMNSGVAFAGYRYG